MNQALLYRLEKLSTRIESEGNRMIDEVLSNPPRLRELINDISRAQLQLDAIHAIRRLVQKERKKI